jgi:hypothetical protein
VAGGIAPFALDRYEDVLLHRLAIEDVVPSRVMPPWLAAPGCTDYYEDRSLSDQQIDLVMRWLRAGAPRGDTSIPSPPVEPSLGLPRVDRLLPMPVAYTPRSSPDDYRCFLIDWPDDRTRYVTGFDAIPGHPSIVHHVIAYLAAPQTVPLFEQLDAADPDPGYACFGGPGGGQSAAMLAAWAPGTPGTNFPPGTGLPVAPGSKVILQVHYNTLAGAAVPDRTAVALKLDDQVDRPAYLLFFADPDWATRGTMHIPAGAPDVTHRFAVDPTPAMALITGGLLPAGQPFRIWSAALHMHLRGTRARLDIRRPGGTDECMLDIPRWDFHWQLYYPFERPKEFRPGDQLSIECHWDNSARNQPVVGGQPLPPQDLNWGEGSGSEMCLGAMYISG